jgi:hypothetical protein
MQIGQKVTVEGFPFATEVIDVRENHVAVWHDVQFARGGFTKWVPIDRVTAV